MRIVVLGAAGRTGAAVVAAAASRRCDVVALARDPDRVVPAPGIIPVRGDVLSPETWAAHAEGTDAIVFAVGSGAGRGPTTVYSEGVRKAVAVAAAAGVRRIVAISAIPVRSSPGAVSTGPKLPDPLLYRFFGETYADMKRMEDLLAASEVDWTVIRPPLLTNMRGRGHYRSAIGGDLPRAGWIARADLALALLDAGERPDWARSIVTVAR